jgi:hypothetical protein
MGLELQMSCSNFKNRMITERFTMDSDDALNKDLQVSNKLFVTFRFKLLFVYLNV